MPRKDYTDAKPTAIQSRRCHAQLINHDCVRDACMVVGDVTPEAVRSSVAVGVVGTADAGCILEAQGVGAGTEGSAEVKQRTLIRRNIATADRRNVEVDTN